MTPRAQAVISTNTEQPKGDKTHTADADGWVTMPDGTQVREKK